jgi:4a-hydroxytetrahydrobiopterin dehydratase
MSRLLEIAVRNSNEAAHDEVEFHPETLFQRNIPDSVTVSDIDEVPLEPKESSWETVTDNFKTYVRKTFYFSMTKHMIYFINEAIKKSDEMQHHPKMIIDHDEIIVELFTHDINDVSSQDLEIAKFVDEIYEDIVYISRF